MAAFIIVVSAPHYAVTDASGGFAFRRLVPGRYRVKAWSERSTEPSVSEVDIESGENQLTLTLEAGAPPPNLDKFGRPR
jgi:hypothetical protein